MRARAVFVVLLWAMAIGAFAAPPSREEEIPLQQITLGENLDLQPGAVYTEELFRWQCCVYPVATPVPARFLVDPPGRGVSIDARSGTITVDADAYPGTTVRVYAILLGGKRVVSHDVHIYTAQSNPLVGRWRQTADLLCFAGAANPFQWTPRAPIQQLSFFADGTYRVVRVPIEISYEYDGPYTFDLANHTVILGVRSGTRLPVNFRAQGTYELRPTTPQQLVLNGPWPGGSTDFGDGCGAVFVRER